MQGSDPQRQNLLPAVRRLEAAGFRAWPASSVQYDGLWAIRLTGGHPAKRLNSINPLDPADHGNMAERIERAAGKFEECGRPLTFRMSPLASEKLTEHLDSEGWQRFGESLVMQSDLSKEVLDGALPQEPLQDADQYVSAAIEIGNVAASLRPGLSEVIAGIKPEAGMFVLEEGGVPVSTTICVRDGDLAGIFEVATSKEQRGRGHARRLLLSALKWAQHRGAKRAWLQVEATNGPALQLYRSMGFGEVYRYHYRQPARG
ncbi:MULTISPECIES: GNAT family N-acetyltransferase [unclassified Aminobacter]|uniref:GNAT family N-acetyltransferase n=1 Tax=unclassified Aminobacter TaxID=2644704 RepID=UPI0004673108|nr:MULTISPECIES: GNAT family N-acetyltransferase [unclassified Aminobacter]TWG55145.1 Acetyltransferases [Aminobacter sp. J44]TWH28902.1 Acetyltransferases [Aminobacter sp. J15]